MQYTEKDVQRPDAGESCFVYYVLRRVVDAPGRASPCFRAHGSMQYVRAQSTENEG